MTHHVFRIEGMTCGHCVRAVEQALSAVRGVHKVEVEIGAARVDAEDTVPRETLLRAIEEEDYRAS